MTHVLITGATGFIGGHLVRSNLQRGHLVSALVLPGDRETAALRNRGVQIHEGDIRNLDDVRGAAVNSDIIFHCAGLVSDWGPTRQFQEIIVNGTENVCKAALDVKASRLVHISTNDVFGHDEAHVMDESGPLIPWGEPYPDHKIAAEKIVWEYHRKFGLPATMVYPCWVYGEGDQTFVPLLADAIIKKDLIFWRRNALVWPAYVGNVVDLLMCIATDPRAVGARISGTRRGINHLARFLR